VLAFAAINPGDWLAATAIGWLAAVALIVLATAAAVLATHRPLGRSILALFGAALTALVALVFGFVEIANGGREVARVASPDGRYVAVVIEGDGLGIGTRPDVHVRPVDVWPVRDVLVWRGADESPRPQRVRFTGHGELEIVDYQGTCYSTRFDPETLERTGGIGGDPGCA